ncbi:hypothetical protein FH972_024766 [Carpinus fangiana]|uniref:Uncharacterized protein n=1 Tax=Carpinus fangiana TaxID=176857 RepID=A0A5N6KZN6_9ROSI|nr:hypothetical protein FH972_024766 [Carpinus fangiana]
MWQANFPKSNFNLEAGDEVEVIADFGSGIDVKKTGVRLIYDKVIDGKMIHYASTSNKDTIVVDDEDASTDQAAIGSKRGLWDDKAESSHGCFGNEQEAKRLRCENSTDDKAESSRDYFDDDREAKRMRSHSMDMIAWRMEEVVRGLSPERSRAKSPARSAFPMSRLLRRGRMSHYTALPKPLIARSESLRLAEALSPLKEGLDRTDGEDSRMEGRWGQWMKRGQLLRAPSISCSAAYKR